ncbi:MAG TPA: TonB-dependent receptor [Gemmatimonadaceae bacterium]|nr:TonB-dependent receptor [Gemmatimonadaceae bacterium]
MLPRLLALVIALPPVAIAQDSARTALPPVRITATRDGPRSPLELPYAVTLTRPDSLAALRRLGVDELLFAVPGVTLANRQNPAQDPRISIRGFGARSAFGVRGVRVLQDGVPLTLPDGQTPVDALELEGAERVEVVRGSASSLYGNAAGGVIDVRSAPPPPVGAAPFARVVGGDATPTVSAVGAAGTLESVGYSASITRVNGRGFRDHSDQRATRGAVRVLFARSDALPGLTLAARISDLSNAESPGALTQAQLDADPRMADPLSVRKRAGKSVRQGDLSLALGRGMGRGGALDAVVYGSVRTLANPLTFATVDVDRSSGGASLRVREELALGARVARLAAGADVQWQHDDRLESENCIDAVATTTACPAGAAPRGARRRDQRELVTSVGPFVRGELALASRLLASAGVRADAVRFQVRDRLVTPTNPDDSGDRTLRAVSPAVGLVWRATTLASLYATASTSFETPTTTELGNKPDGSAGINPDLQPQRTATLELGARGLLPATGVRWDVALFEARARDELVPFDIPNGGGRRYFRNAGRTRRHGGELGVQTESGPLALQAAYTYSRFRYLEYTVGTTSYAGRRIPGVPEHALASSVVLRRGPATLSATADIASALDVDDANSAQAPARTIVGVALSTSVRVSGAVVAPMVALQNLGGVRSVGSVSVNAAGGKFFEPAPGRTLLVRLAVRRETEQR